MPVDIYALALRGYVDSRVARFIGITPECLTLWKRKHPSVRYALELARKHTLEGRYSFKSYVKGRMNSKVRAIWDKIEVWAEDDDGQKRIKALLNGYPIKVRQSLFFHAWVSHSFNASSACRFVGINKTTLEKWKLMPQFIRLMDELKFHRNNFFEEKLIDQVAMGDPSAIQFVNRTANRDRGYGEKIEVENTGTVKHELVLDLDKLSLSLACRKEILDAMRAYKAKQAQKAIEPAAIDVETVEDEEDDDNK